MQFFISKRGGNNACGFSYNNAYGVLPRYMNLQTIKSIPRPLLFCFSSRIWF